MPYEVYTDNLFDMVNEATVLLVMTMSCSFTAGNMDPLTASNFGFIVIGIICANIAVSLSIFIGSNLQLVYSKLKAFWDKRKKDLPTQPDKSKTVPIKPSSESLQSQTAFRDSFLDVTATNSLKQQERYMRETSITIDHNIS